MHAVQAIQRRNEVFDGTLDEGILRDLQAMLEEHNPLVQQIQAAVTAFGDCEQATIVIDAEGGWPACCYQSMFLGCCCGVLFWGGEACLVSHHPGCVPGCACLT